MNILAISDAESKYYWDYFEKSKLNDIDLILSCGDLKPEYLSFLATFSKAPILYIHGNHDGYYETTPPEGCICIEDSIYVHQGIRILGLGGSMCYNHGLHQYTQKEMEQRVKKLHRTIKKHKGFDILLTHSPAYQKGDCEDLAHMGFQCFNILLEQYQPRYFIHGHVHLNYDWKQNRICQHENTTIINAYERYLFTYETLESLSP